MKQIDTVLDIWTDNASDIDGRYLIKTIRRYSWNELCVLRQNPFASTVFHVSKRLLLIQLYNYIKIIKMDIVVLIRCFFDKKASYHMKL